MFSVMHDMMTAGQMTWPMGVGMILVAVVIALATVALVKFIISR